MMLEKSSNRVEKGQAALSDLVEKSQIASSDLTDKSENGLSLVEETLTSEVNQVLKPRRLHDPQLLNVVAIFLCLAGTVLPVLKRGEDFWIPTEDAQMNAVWALSMSLPCVVGTVVALRCLHIRGAYPTVVFSAVVLLHHVRTASAYVVNEKYRTMLQDGMTNSMAILTFVGWTLILDSVLAHIRRFAEAQNEFQAASKVIQKWKTISQGFASFQKQEKDQLYGLTGEHHESAAMALLDVFSVYFLLAKGAGAALLVAFLMGVDLYENIAVFGVSVGLTGFVGAMHLSATTKNLIPLALSNPFFVGEIISLSNSGAQAADNPSLCLAGFVEGITMMHVVLRDFRKKQTFIPHYEFSGLTVHNWSRRPSKLCHLTLLATAVGSGNASRVKSLAQFVREWIDVHPSIDQHGYKKACIKSVSKGVEMEVIFYPTIGVSARGLKEQFLLGVMEAADRLNVTLVPEDLCHAFPGQDGASECSTRESSDVIFTDLLPRNGDPVHV